jgi:flagellar hook-basal body complex protein FliE
MRARSGGETGFANTLNEAINRVDGAQQVANRNIEAYVAGEMDDLHEVMISMNTAKATFNLMTEVRNRVLESYQELMRLQV